MIHYNSLTRSFSYTGQKSFALISRNDLKAKIEKAVATIDNKVVKGLSGRSHGPVYDDQVYSSLNFIPIEVINELDLTLSNKKFRVRPSRTMGPRSNGDPSLSPEELRAREKKTAIAYTIYNYIKDNGNDAINKVVDLMIKSNKSNLTDWKKLFADFKFDLEDIDMSYLPDNEQGDNIYYEYINEDGIKSVAASLKRRFIRIKEDSDKGEQDAADTNIGYVYRKLDSKISGTISLEEFRDLILNSIDDIIKFDFSKLFIKSKRYKDNYKSNEQVAYFLKRKYYGVKYWNIKFGDKYASDYNREQPTWYHGQTNSDAEYKIYEEALYKGVTEICKGDKQKEIDLWLAQPNIKVTDLGLKNTKHGDVHESSFHTYYYHDMKVEVEGFGTTTVEVANVTYTSGGWN